MKGTKKAAGSDKARLRRLLWHTWKWTWFPLGCFMALAIGLSVGYVYLGKQSAEDLFHLSTWRHLLDLVFAE